MATLVLHIRVTLFGQVLLHHIVKNHNASFFSYSLLFIGYLVYEIRKRREKKKKKQKKDGFCSFCLGHFSYSYFVFVLKYN